ncbi:unnamed protein product [Orchesella dallaii]|uniref:Uncharacterized protein n=1 Tax=Orchesella dallaii TaxID=48710 RepID=A0ABP1R582_9HEXA
MGEKCGKDEEKRSKRSKFIDEKGGIKVKGREASVARIRGEINESNWTGNGQQFTSSYSSSSSSSMTRKPSFTSSSGGGDRDGGGKSSNNDDLGPNLFSSMAIVAVAQTYYTPSPSIDITSSSPHPNNNGHGGSSTDVTTLPSLSKRLLLPKNRGNRIYAAPLPSPILSSNQKNPPCNELILKKMECTGESKVAGEKQRSKLTTTNTSSTSSSSWTCLELNKMNKSGNDIAIIEASPSLAFTESKMDSRIGGNKQEHGGQLPFQQPSKRKWLQVREREARVNKTKRDIAPATTITRDLVLPSLSHFVEATVVTTTERKLIGSGRENESALDLWDYDDEDGSSGNAKIEKNNSNNKSLCRSNLLKKSNAKENGKMGGSSSVATKSGNKSTLRFSSGKKVGTVKNPITLGCKNLAVTTKPCVGAVEMSNSNSNNTAIPLPNINIPVVTATAVKEKKVSKSLDLEENGERLLPLKKCTGRNMGNILTRQTTLISSKRSNTSAPPSISYTTNIKGNNVTPPSTSGSNIGRAGSGGGGASGKNSLKKESQTGSTTGEVKLERNENVKIAEKNNIPFCAHNRPRLSYPDNEKRWANSVSSQLPPSLSPLTLSPSSFSSWNNGNTRHPVKSPVSQEVKPAKIGKFRKLTRNVGSRSSSTTPAATKYDRQVSRFSFKRMAIVSPSPQLRIHSQSTYLSKKAVAFIPTTCASHAAPTPSNRGNEIVDQVKQKVSTSTLSPRVPSKCLDFLVGTGRRSCTKAEQSKLLLPSEKMDGMREELEMKVCSKDHVEHDECRRVAQNSKVEMDSKNESESSRSKKETSFDSEGVGSLDENEDDVNTILHKKTETRVEFMTDSLVDEEHDNNGRLLSNIISPPTLFISSSRDEGDDANTTSFLDDDDHAHFKCTFQQLPSPNLRSESCCHNFDNLPAREIGGDFEAAINKPFSSISLAFNPTRRCANDDGVDYDDDTESNERRRPFPYSLLHIMSHDESASSHDSCWSNLAPNHLNQETPFPRECFTDNQNHHEHHEENGRTVNAKVPQENDGNEMMLTRAALSDQSYHSHYHYHQHHHHYPQEPSSTTNCPLILSEPLSSSMFPFYDDDFDDSSFVPISNILSDTLIKNFPKWLQEKRHSRHSFIQMIGEMEQGAGSYKPKVM